MATEIAIEQIEPHPRNSNVMTEEALGKLERHIARTGRYEPLVVRPLGQSDHACGAGMAPDGAEGGVPRYQVLNGHHRLEVLRRLGRATARCEVWEVDEREALVLLATLNRLQGRDDPLRRAALVAELAARSPGADVAALARFLPEDRAAVERALALGRERLPAPVAAEAARAGALRPMTFFLRAEEMEVVRRALATAALRPRAGEQESRRTGETTTASPGSAGGFKGNSSGTERGRGRAGRAGAAGGDVPGKGGVNMAGAGGGVRQAAKRRGESTLAAGVRVEAGRLEDWYALAGLHYRSHRIGGLAKIFVLRYYETAGVRNGNDNGRTGQSPGPTNNDHGGGELIGVIAYSYPAVSLAARNRALAPLVARLPARGRARFWNAHLRTISRVVLEPNWRGLGLAARLVRETLPQAGVPYVEALAAMARVHPFFAQAGMTEYDSPSPPQSERLREALAAAGLSRADARSAAALTAAVNALAEEQRGWLVGEIERWARSYLGAKTAKVWRPTLEQACGYVARFLYSSPSYYLWANGEMVGEQGGADVPCGGEVPA